MASRSGSVMCGLEQLTLAESGQSHWHRDRCCFTDTQSNKPANPQLSAPNTAPFHWHQKPDFNLFNLLFSLKDHINIFPSPITDTGWYMWKDLRTLNCVELGSLSRCVRIMCDIPGQNPALKYSLSRRSESWSPQSLTGLVRSTAVQNLLHLNPTNWRVVSCKLCSVLNFWVCS